ncbi:MAG: HAD hydrolase-like protein [Chloroflexi bacterium]|nr:HAD hydrolase-like protein [Chloroflexota bacterium]
MSRYDLVIFDLDGTLIDSFPGIIDTFQHVLASIGMPALPPDRVRQFIGPPLVQTFGALLAEDPVRVRQAMDAFRDRYAAVGLYDHEPYAGIPSLLAELHGRGTHLALATSKRQIFAEAILRHQEWSSYFVRVAGSNDDGTGASKADLIATARNGVDAVVDTVMVGDHPADIEGARANGIDSIAVSYGYGSIDELLAAGPLHMVDSVDALRELLIA